MFWAVVNMVMVCATLGVVLEKRQRRAFPRIEVSVKASLLSQGELVPVLVNDLSAGGARLVVAVEHARDYVIGTKFTLNVPLSEGAEPSEINAVVVNSRRDNGNMVLGLVFAHESHAEVSSKVMLVFGNSDRWWQFQKSRSGKQGIGRNLVFFVRTGYIAAVAHFVALGRLFIKNLLIYLRTQYKRLFDSQLIKE